MDISSISGTSGYSPAAPSGSSDSQAKIAQLERQEKRIQEKLDDLKKNPSVKSHELVQIYQQQILAIQKQIQQIRDQQKANSSGGQTAAATAAARNVTETSVLDAIG